MLETEGYRVCEAANGEEVSRAEAERPRVVLMDLQLPGCDGIEATRQPNVTPGHVTFT
jgi:CheY-like chemotaxis protein